MRPFVSRSSCFFVWESQITSNIKDVIRKNFTPEAFVVYRMKSKHYFCYENIYIAPF